MVSETYAEHHKSQVKRCSRNTVHISQAARKRTPSNQSPPEKITIVFEHVLRRVAFAPSKNYVVGHVQGDATSFGIRVSGPSERLGRL